MRYQKTAFACIALVAPAFMLLGARANAEEFHANFSGFEEVGPLNAETGAILSAGTATLDLKLDRNAQTATYVLTFSGLSAQVLQSHIHFGKRHVPGGVMVFLCSNLGNGPAGTPACPALGGSVSGTLTAASVTGPTAQNVPAADFGGLVAALDSDTAYGNIHTNAFPGGEIRGQLRRNDDDKERHDHDPH